MYDCRVVTISTNHIMMAIMISIMTQFPFLASSEFLFTRAFVITVACTIKQLTTTIFSPKSAFWHQERTTTQYIWIILTFIW